MAAPSARLALDPSVRSAFGSGSHRSVHLRVEGESLVLRKTSGSLGSPCAESFDGLGAEVEGGEAEFVLFSLDGSEGGKGKWLLVAWVPDSAKVRDKMLYSSSKEDLKKALGLTSFAGDYYANVEEDLKWDAYAASLVKVVAMNEREEALQQEKMDKIADGGSQLSKQGAMGVVPFSLSPCASSALDAFARGGSHLVQLGQARDAPSLRGGIAGAVGSRPLAGELGGDEPSFVIVRCVGDVAGSTKEVFVYSCPEAAPVRTKMSFSTAKSAALAEIKKAGVVFDRTFEITEPPEIDAVLETVAKGGREEASSAAAEIKHKKPSRPGKGKARKVKKFDF
eukprot:CAMPEP_0197571096 /NCGR_PEP_ID=MMETSP1320-20131121/41780_1 /TAXON_ID=91990 /ORGANISM="Bolidomonas sp., Strain RCC2347" /LENGTH=337 /DNA_ID=CAMNT_0043133579 /DNA_START=62 /DNA_END=1073 /DNA_ORIENTATION=+